MSNHLFSTVMDQKVKLQTVFETYPAAGNGGADPRRVIHGVYRMIQEREERQSGGNPQQGVGLPALGVVEISSSNNRNPHIFTAFHCTGGGVTEKAAGGVDR